MCRLEAMKDFLSSKIDEKKRLDCFSSGRPAGRKTDSV